MRDKQDKVVILDKREQLEAAGLLVLYSRLKLEVKTGPGGPQWRMPPGPAVRRILNVKTRSKVKLLEQFKEYLIKKGIKNDE